MFAPTEAEGTRPETFDGPTRAPLSRVLVFWPDGWIERELAIGQKLTVGRGEDCDLRVNLPSVSRRHLVLELLEEGLGIEDVGSANGTRLAGKRLPPHGRALLAVGATLEIGQATLVLVGDRDLTGDDIDLLGIIDPRTGRPPSRPPEPPPIGSSPTTEIASFDDARTSAMAPTPGASTEGPRPRRDTDPPSAAPRGAVMPTMDRVRHLVDLVASGKISVILAGETGVGKDVFAERVHARSTRAKGPFVRLDCASLPESLLEGELFGYERGAFTGATQSKPGLLEVATRGTLFLHDVDALSLSTQAKLLHAIERGEVTRLGAANARKVDVRLVAATNRDLVALVGGGAFRRDLYYRLNGVTITVPPLRERTAEIPTLVAAIAADLAGGRNVDVTTRALDLLQKHPWPGNVRELRNVVERALLLAGDGPIDTNHLDLRALPAAPPAAIVKRPEPTSEEAPHSTHGTKLRSELAAVERQRIIDALDSCAGNQTSAAKLLGISRRTLLMRLDAYDLPRPRKGRA